MPYGIQFTKRERLAFQRKVLAFRKKNRLSQKRLSLLMECSNSTVWGVENTLDPVGYSTVQAFERVESDYTMAAKRRLTRSLKAAAGPRFNRGVA